MARTFAKYLVERGLVDAAQALDALEACASRRAPLGKLAVESGALTMRDVFAVLRRQAGTQDRFGETAVAMGLLTVGQVSDLLRRQESSGPTISDVLVETAAATREALDAARVDFECARRDELHERA